MLDAVSNDGLPPTSDTQDLVKKKKILPTIGPIGWTNNFKKKKKSSKISPAELPPSSAGDPIPSTPSQQPPKKYKQKIVPQLPISPAENPMPSTPSQQQPKKKKPKTSNPLPLNPPSDPSLKQTSALIPASTRPHEIQSIPSALENPQSTNLKKNKKGTRVSLPELPPSSTPNPMPLTPSDQPPKKKKRKISTHTSLNSLSDPSLDKTPGLIVTPNPPHQTQSISSNLESLNSVPTPHSQPLPTSLGHSAQVNPGSQGPSGTPQPKPNIPVWPSLDSFSNLTPQEILARFAPKATTTPSVKKRKKSGVISEQPVLPPSGVISEQPVLPPSGAISEQPAIPQSGAISEQPAIPRSGAISEQPAIPQSGAISEQPIVASNQPSSAPLSSKNCPNASTGQPDQPDQPDTMSEAALIAPPSRSNLSKSVNIELAKPDEQVGRTTTSTSTPLTAPNLLQATNFQTQPSVTSGNSQYHQPAFSSATLAVTDQDRSSNHKSENQTEIAAVEKHSRNIPQQTCHSATKKERLKARAKQKKLQKRQSLRSGSVSTTQDAKCLSSVSTSPHHMPRDFYVPSRQSTPISMVKVPKHFGRWELSIPSDRDVPVGLLARMHQFLDEAVCAGFAKPIFRDPVQAILEPSPSCQITASTESVSDISRSKQLDKLSTSANPTHATDESNYAAPRPNNPFPSERNNLTVLTPGTIPDNQRKRAFSVCSSSLSEDINSTVMMTLGLEDSYQTEHETDSVNQRTPMGHVVDSNPKIINPPSYQLEKDAAPRTVSESDTVLPETDPSSSRMSKPEPNSDKQTAISDNSPDNNSPAKPSPVTSSNSSENSSSPGHAEIVLKDAPIQLSDRAPSNKSESTISTLTLPQLEPRTSASPILNKPYTINVSKSDSSSEDESDSSHEDRAPPSAQRPPKRTSVESSSSSSDEEASSTISSHHSSPVNPPPAQSVGQDGRAGLYHKGPMNGRRKTLDTFRPLDFTLNTPEPIGLAPLSTDPRNHDTNSDGESNSTSDEDDSESDSSDGAPKKKADNLPHGLPAHKLAGSTASSKPTKSSGSIPQTSSSDPNKKPAKGRKSLAKFWAIEEAKVLKSQKKA